MLPRPNGFLYHQNSGPGARTPRPRRIPNNRFSNATAAREDKLFYSLEADLDELRIEGARKGIADAGVTDIGNSTDGKPIRALKLGNGPHKCLITGCYHAREWISVEVAFLVAEYLVTAHPSGAPTTLEERRIKHLMQNRTVWIVPMVNPDGHEMTLTRNRLWRANAKSYRPGDPGMPGAGFNAPVAAGQVPAARTIHYPLNPGSFYQGVDVNRNHDCRSNSACWGHETFQPAHPNIAATSRNPTDCAVTNLTGNDVGSQTWCGPSAASEVETQRIEALVRAQGFKTSLHFHSCYGLYLYPDALDAAGDNYTKWLGRGMQTLNKQAPGAIAYDCGSPVARLYAATGSSMDFCREQSGGLPTYTPEVRPKQGTASFRDHQFSHLPETEIWPTFLENLCPALAVINAAGHTDVTRAKDQDIASAKPAGKGQVVRNCWEVFRGWTYPPNPAP